MSARPFFSADEYLAQLRFFEQLLTGLDDKSIDAAMRWLAPHVIEMPNVRSVLESLLTEIEAREST